MPIRSTHSCRLIPARALPRIARAVISKPELLLADEPTGNVDPDLSERLMHLFAELHRMGTTVIVATHEVSLLDKFPVLVFDLLPLEGRKTA